MFSLLHDKLREALSATLPIVGIVYLLCFTIAPIPSSLLMTFTIGAALLIVGTALFSLGAETAMQPIGSKAGAEMTRSHRLWLVVLGSFVLGAIVTISEPDLQVLANQVPAIPNGVLIGVVAVGVGLFLVVAMLRILFAVRLSWLLIGCYVLVFRRVLFRSLFAVRLSWLLIGCYVLVFALAALAPQDFLAVSFDAGGVTTGPMTVPFIMALGIGVSSIRSDQRAEGDSFGLVALSSVGPILAVLLLGLFFPGEGAYQSVVMPEVDLSRQLIWVFVTALPHYAKEVGMALAPIAVFFLLFHFFRLKLDRRPFVKLLVGLGYTYVGLVLFLTGVNAGFMPVGYYLGNLIGGMRANWILIPLAMVIGWFIINAEPAVAVLNRQVEEITAGSIPARAMRLALAIGMALSLALAMVRVLTGLPILYILVPGYAIALGLSFFVPEVFTSIAFDSGGVASGPMTATFLLPFAMGACEAIGGPDRVVTDAFGVVAMVAMTPLITIQVLGLYYRIRTERTERSARAALLAFGPDDELISV